MSQSMNTTAGPVGSAAPPSNNRWWAIAAGIGLAAVLGYGAALVATDHLPGTTHTAAAPVAAVATPQVESIAGSDDLATRSAAGSSGAVVHSALDPFEEQSGAVSSAVGTSGAAAQSYAGVDDLATRSSAVGASGIVEQSILDALEERSGAVSSVTTETMWGTEFNDPSELYPAVAGTSGVVAHSALDPFEQSLGSSEPQAAVGTGDVSAAEIIEREISLALVGSSAGALSSRELIEQEVEAALGLTRSGAEEPLANPYTPGDVVTEIESAVGYFDGQWHNVEGANKYPTPEFR